MCYLSTTYNKTAFQVGVGNIKNSQFFLMDKKSLKHHAMNDEYENKTFLHITWISQKWSLNNNFYWGPLPIFHLSQC